MDKLRAELEALVYEGISNPEEYLSLLSDLVSVYPFNEYEYIISSLLGEGVLSLERYHELRDEYFARNTFLYLFEISAPRGFGERWAQGNLKQLIPDLQKPTRRLDPDYSGQYDFYLVIGETKIRIEVKASRAVDFESDEPLYVKALSSDSSSRFDMNFQQIKPRYCDVFVWLGVWRDRVRYWVVASDEVERSPYYSSGQHRGNIGEGQLHITRENIDGFERFETSSTEILEAILNAYSRQQGQ